MFALSDHPVGVEARLQQLTGDDAALLGYCLTDETSKGYYYTTLRMWPHPDAEDSWTFSVRYAYLTKGDGGDGWTDEGMNMRVSHGRKRFLQAMSRMFAGGIPRLAGGDPSAHNATEE